jgi:acyl CoA:acetate/3-ketoacid CoA transferase beta subunit
MEMKKSLLTILSLALALPSFGQESMQKQTSFRELLFSGKKQFLFLSPSETETIIIIGTSGVDAKRAIEYCSAFGGKAYLVKYKQVEGFGGAKQLLISVQKYIIAIQHDSRTFECKKEE